MTRILGGGAAMTAPLAGDNFLTDLAARIRAEHEAVSSALKRASGMRLQRANCLSRRRGSLAMADGFRGCGIIARSPNGPHGYTSGSPRIAPRSKTKCATTLRI